METGSQWKNYGWHTADTWDTKILVRARLSYVNTAFQLRPGCWDTLRVGFQKVPLSAPAVKTETETSPKADRFHLKPCCQLLLCEPGWRYSFDMTTCKYEKKKKKKIVSTVGERSPHILHAQHKSAHKGPCKETITKTPVKLGEQSLDKVKTQAWWHSLAGVCQVITLLRGTIYMWVSDWGCQQWHMAVPHGSNSAVWNN